MKVAGGALLALLAAPVAILIVIAGLLTTAGASPTAGESGLRGVPPEFEPWIRRAVAECDQPELSPALMAAQLHQESGFSTARSTVSWAGAKGPAQFVPDTWTTWGRDIDGKHGADPYDVADAVMAQGRYMCSLLKDAKAAGYHDDARRLALAGYNAGWGTVIHYRGVPPIEFANGETFRYVKAIMAMLDDFAGPPALNVSGSGAGADALRRAAARIGTPYSYGGGGPGGPGLGFCDDGNGFLRGRCAASTTTGFDCSSLVQYAYWPHTQLPRTAAAQYQATSHRPITRGQLRPGDLLFWAHRDGSIYHVGLYAGDGRVLHAPRTGRSVELVPLDSAMPAGDYRGATRA
ncbi:NlpC/P60 family protein [Streptomyces sp. ZAF1911]|uniref:C40 family peptidase n=1 Tax=Streptomyces sp. ZAF1911 TaxID=2944129 RepID=UPI00237A1BE4|nr:NlpC/P60 family protein [Streptomyces sp. ZAF1911]MDD9383166.1 NlpC/P60 family protein [Streptomyces sp. ZAF1911]